MKRRGVPVLLLAVLCFCLGCASPQRYFCPRVADAEPKQPIQEGYALLYALANQEKNVDRLMRDHGTSPRSQEVMEEIARVNRDLLGSLERWAQDDPARSGSRSGPPDLEAQGRDLMRQEVTWQLLLSGKRESAKTLLLAQHQTLIYESCLLKAIRGSEGCKERRKETGEYAERIDRLSSRVAELITVEH